MANVEHIQLKRLKDNSDNGLGYVPEDGEIVILDIPDGISGIDVSFLPDNTPITNCIVVGDGESTISSLIENKKIYLQCSTILDMCSTINGNISTEISNISTSIPKGSNDTPALVSSDAGTAGNGATFSKSDHIHQIERGTITTVLENYHNIEIGTEAPNDAIDADIYIRYE